MLKHLSPAIACLSFTSLFSPSPISDGWWTLHQRSQGSGRVMVLKRSGSFVAVWFSSSAALRTFFMTLFAFLLVRTMALIYDGSEWWGGCFNLMLKWHKLILLERLVFISFIKRPKKLICFYFLPRGVCPQTSLVISVPWRTGGTHSTFLPKGPIVASSHGYTWYCGTCKNLNDF